MPVAALAPALVRPMWEVKRRVITSSPDLYLWANSDWALVKASEALDAMGLPVAGETVDAATIAFGIRNVLRAEVACKELLRVLRPGGRLFFTAQRYGEDVQAAVRPGEPIYIGPKVVSDLPQQLGCRIVSTTTSSMRYYIVLEK